MRVSILVLGRQQDDAWGLLATYGPEFLTFLCKSVKSVNQCLGRHTMPTANLQIHVHTGTHTDEHEHVCTQHACNK